MPLQLPRRPADLAKSPHLLAAALLLCAAVAACAWRWQSAQELSKAETALAQAKVAAATPAVSTPADTTDFVAHLPPAAETPPLLQELQRSTKARAVQLTGVSTAATDPTAQALGRIAVSVTLQGSYPAIKGVLADALARYEKNLVVQRLAVQRRVSPTELEAKVELLLLGRPLLVAAAPTNPAAPAAPAAPAPGASAP